MASKSEVTLISASELAEWLCIELQVVSRLAQAGVLPKASRGKYPQKEAVQAYIRYTRSQNRRKTADLDLNSQNLKLEKEKEDLRLVRLKADEQELKVLKGKGQLVDKDQVLNVYGQLAGNCKSRMLGLPTKLAAQLRNSASDVEAKQILDRHIKKALEEIAKQNISFETDSSEERADAQSDD
jgi:phage terminase Nu1 subunit (DNA packaging protein)